MNHNDTSELNPNRGEMAHGPYPLAEGPTTRWHVGCTAMHKLRLAAARGRWRKT